MLFLGCFVSFLGSGIVLAQEVETLELTARGPLVAKENVPAAVLSSGGAGDLGTGKAVTVQKIRKTANSGSGGHQGASIARADKDSIATSAFQATVARSRSLKKAGLNAVPSGSTVKSVESQELKALQKHARQRKAALKKDLDARPLRARRLLKKDHHVEDNSASGESSEFINSQK